MAGGEGSGRGRVRLAQAEAVRVAASWLQEGKRIDMQALAVELRVTRMTLHRHTGGRAGLMGEALWFLAEQAWERHIAAEQARHRPGDEGLRSARIIRSFNNDVITQPSVRTLFETEPEVAVRLITDPAGAVEPRTIALVVRLIEMDEREGRLHPIIDRESLAYALVKLAEGCLFGELAVGRPVAVQVANEVQTALLEAGRIRPDQR